jgi:hypothetical protein
VWAASGRRGDVQAKLKDASLSLVDAGGRELLHALVEGTSLVETCMGSTWRTTFALDSFELTDRFTPDTLFPSLIAPRRDRRIGQTCVGFLRPARGAGSAGLTRALVGARAR